MLLTDDFIVVQESVEINFEEPHKVSWEATDTLQPVPPPTSREWQDSVDATANFSRNISAARRGCHWNCTVEQIQMFRWNQPIGIYPRRRIVRSDHICIQHEEKECKASADKGTTRVVILESSIHNKLRTMIEYWTARIFWWRRTIKK